MSTCTGLREGFLPERHGVGLRVGRWEAGIPCRRNSPPQGEVGGCQGQPFLQSGFHWQITWYHWSDEREQEADCAPLPAPKLFCTSL